MNYSKKDFSNLIGIKGFSKDLLKTHFKLYEGYVANTNRVFELLNNLREEQKEDTPLFAELKRRLGWEWNGMRLHELYFGNLGGDGDKSLAPMVVDILKKSYGSFNNWEKDFIATAKMRGDRLGDSLLRFADWNSF